MKLISHTIAAVLGAIGALLGALAWDAWLEAQRRKGWHR